MAPSYYQNTWPIYALVVFSAAAVVAVTSAVTAVAVTSAVTAVAVEVEFVEGGRLVKIQLDVLGVESGSLVETVS